jgi:hypothetical protein
MLSNLQRFFYISFRVDNQIQFHYVDDKIDSGLDRSTFCQGQSDLDADAFPEAI